VIISRIILTTALACTAPVCGEVIIAQTGKTLELSNGATRLVAQMENGRGRGFGLFHQDSRQKLASVRIGGEGGWDAKLTGSVAQGNQAGSLTFSRIQASGAGGKPTFHDDSVMRVELRGSSSFPIVTFRLVLDRSGSPAPARFLACQMADAQFLYRGGFQTPLPTVDPFAAKALTSELPLGACPVPAIGLWNPDSATFVGYEFQEARGSNKTSKHLLTACRVSAAGSTSFALIIPKKKTPFVVESRFRLIYSTELPTTRSPNEFVLDHFWRNYRGRIPRVPEVNDLGWMPRREDFVPDDRTSSALLRRVQKSTAEEGLLFTNGALLVQGDSRGILNLFQSKGSARQQAALKQWRILESKAIRKQIKGDKCVFWRSPIEGEYEAWAGGKAAATVDSPHTWSIGASLLAIYQNQRNKGLLEAIDGVFRWTRHCSFTRAGDVSAPGAASAPAAVRASTDFLMGFYHAFKNEPDQTRRKMAEEAIRLGRAILYRNLAIYTGDPDETDTLDPTFLMQSDSSPESFGMVSWNNTSELIRSMALYHVETGDPVLKALVHGALERWPLGSESDGLHTIESLVSFRSHGAAKGIRFGLRAPGDRLAEYLQPIGAARLRILCGQKQALVFGADSTPAGIKDYRFQEPGNISFKLSSRTKRPVEIIITSPFRNLRGRQARLNGRPADAEAVGRHGEHVVIRKVRTGDVISIGEVNGSATETVKLPLTAKTGDGWDEFRFIQLTGSGAAPRTVDTSWHRGDSWAGLTEGIHFAHGVPFRLDTRMAFDATPGPLKIKIGKGVTSAFLFASTSQPPVIEATDAKGGQKKWKLKERLPALSSGPIRSWRIDVYPIRLTKSATPISLQISGSMLVFAVTTHPGKCAALENALARAEESRKAREAEVRAAKALQLAKQRIIPESRARVRAAIKGKVVRIAFVPPHEAYTEILRDACTRLGLPPVMLSEQNLIDPKEFNAGRYPIAVYSAPETFVHTVKQPGDGAEALKKYLRDGGCLVVAARGYPFYYPMELKDGKLERIEGARHAEVCGALEIPINFGPVPKLEAIPRYELVDGQKMFSHLPQTFRYVASVGGPYRIPHAGGLPKGDIFRPMMRLTSLAAKTSEVVAATIDHHCKSYKGGRAVVLWGNILAQEIGPDIAIDLMTHVVCTARLKPEPPHRPVAAILPRDMGGHEKAIARACASTGLKTRALTLEEFADPAEFNPRRYPIAIHAVGGEDFIDKIPGRSELWRVYVDYVKSGGLLVACGNMWQFYYAGTIDRKGQWRQQHDREQLILNGLGLTGGFGFGRNPGSMKLRSLPGQDVIKFSSPIPLHTIHFSQYRAISAGEMQEGKFIPIARVVGGGGQPFGGYVIANLRLSENKHSGGEVIWFWGNLLDNERSHSLLNQAIKYAFERRKRLLSPSP
jgi:hypothetical protein